MKRLPQLPQGLIKQLTYNPSGRKLSDVSVELWDEIKDYLEANYTQKNIRPEILNLLVVARDELRQKRGSANAEALPFDERLLEKVAPIFDADMGRRLKYMRMALLLDQRQLGERLGVPQQMVAKIELGKTKVSREPVPVIRFIGVFGADVVMHIFFGDTPLRYDYEEINRKYWREKDRRKGNKTARRPTNAERRRLRRRV